MKTKPSASHTKEAKSYEYYRGKKAQSFHTIMEITHLSISLKKWFGVIISSSLSQGDSVLSPNDS
jgi:hypothetical protein